MRTRFIVASGVTIAILAGCGGNTRPASTPTSTPTPTAKSRDEAAVRAAILGRYKADSIGDYNAECEYFTAEAAKMLIEASDPGAAPGTTCPEALAAKAKELGPDSLADSNKISANAKVTSVVVGRDTAQAIVDLGAPDPASMELERVGDTWLISRDTSN
jgi:hypothetical protein